MRVLHFARDLGICVLGIVVFGGAWLGLYFAGRLVMDALFALVAWLLFR